MLKIPKNRSHQKFILVISLLKVLRKHSVWKSTKMSHFKRLGTMSAYNCTQHIFSWAPINDKKTGLRIFTDIWRVGPKLAVSPAHLRIWAQQQTAYKKPDFFKTLTHLTSNTLGDNMKTTFAVSWIDFFKREHRSALLHISIFSSEVILLQINFESYFSNKFWILFLKLILNLTSQINF